MHKDLNYYLKNGPEKVVPLTKDQMFSHLFLAGEGIEGLLKSPFALSDHEIKLAISNFSKNLLKYYPWKLYLEIADRRGLDTSVELDKLPYYDVFKMVDEDEFIPNHNNL